MAARRPSLEDQKTKPLLGTREEVAHVGKMATCGNLEDRNASEKLAGPKCQGSMVAGLFSCAYKVHKETEMS